MPDVLDGLLYTRSHEWLRVEEDGTVTVGLTDHGQDSVGRIDSVGFPSVPARVSAGDHVCSLASAESMADLRSLWDGEIADINESILDSPGFVNSDPYGDGWLYRIRPDGPIDPAAHLDSAGYRSIVEE